MEIPKDIEAEIYFLKTSEGGRNKPIISGYRPQFHYNDQDWDAVHTYPDVDSVNPGDTAKAYISFISPHKHVKHVHEGMDFLIREGSQTVGKGYIKKIVDLESSVDRVEKEKQENNNLSYDIRHKTKIINRIFCFLLVLPFILMLPLSLISGGSNEPAANAMGLGMLFFGGIALGTIIATVYCLSLILGTKEKFKIGTKILIGLMTFVSSLIILLIISII